MVDKSDESSPLLHRYVPSRSVVTGDAVLEFPSEEVLIIRRSFASRAASIALAATIGCLCSAFLYWFLQPLLFLGKFRLTFDFVIPVAGASLGVLLSLFGMIATIFERPIRFDQRRGIVKYDGWFFGGWEHDLADLLAIQFCQGKSDLGDPDSRRPKITPQYQVNLVFRNSSLTRRNIRQQTHAYRVKQIGRHLSEFLNVPLVDYVGPAGTMDAGDAEIRRLLASRKR